MRARFLLMALATTALIATATLAGAADMTPIFGPSQFTRNAGRPQTFTATFEHCGTAPCQIVVLNGDDNGKHRVSSASIRLNGKEIIGPKNFNQRVARIVRPVMLGDENRLTIRLTSNPGGFITVTVECLTPAAVLEAGDAGVNLFDPMTLLSALPIRNTGTAPAEDVQVTAITLEDGTLTSPTLPADLGTIPAGGFAVLHADFSGDSFAPEASFALTVEGTYMVGDDQFCFTLEAELTIPPAAPGSAPFGTVMVASSTVTDAPFPPQPPMPDLDEVNPSRWTVPIAPFVPGTPTPTGTEAMPAPGAAVATARPIISAAAAGPIVFTANNGLGITSGISIAEPSGASTGDDVVFATANKFAAYSMNGGGSFTSLNPTAVFPADAVGFCCDQIVQYVPSIDRFVWFLQGNGFRLAVASPADIVAHGGTAWTYWNLTPGIFGAITGTGFDYPDLAVGNGYLYMSWDAGFPCPSGCNWGFQVARTSLAGLQAGGTIVVEFTDPANGRMAWGSHLMQDTGNEIFWAGHNNNSSMRIFSAAEGSNMYFWRDRGISSWPTGGLSSMTPDGQDWVSECGGGFPGTNVIGATRVGSQLWFAWAAGTNDNFPKAHVEMVAFDRSDDFSVSQHVQIWNSSYAFAYPALTTNRCTGEVGLSLEYGGGGHYQNHVVGLWGDFVVYVTTTSDVGTCRFGDYVTIRQRPPDDANPGNLFTAFGYGLESVPPPGTGTTSDIRFVEFGRPASSCIPIPQ